MTLLINICNAPINCYLPNGGKHKTMLLFFFSSQNLEMFFISLLKWNENANEKITLGYEIRTVKTEKKEKKEKKTKSKQLNESLTKQMWLRLKVLHIDLYRQFWCDLNVVNKTRIYKFIENIQVLHLLNQLSQHHRQFYFQTEF